MKILYTSLFFGCFLLHQLVPQVSAAAEDPILALPDGQVILSISATERREVTEDLLVASLSCLAIDSNLRTVQNDINTTMAKALALAKTVASVQAATGSYQVYETVEPRTKEKKWRGQQSLTLKSLKAQDLLDLVGQLQGMKLTMNGLDYILDPKTAVELQDALMEAALKQLQVRADRAAKALGKSTAELRDVHVQGADLPFSASQDGGMMMRAQAAPMAMAPPVAAAGETTISLSVSSRVLLKP